MLHQVPEGSIIPSESPAAQSPLFDFSSISEYVIPSRGFYERLVTVCVNRYRVLGYPVYIEHERYATSDTLSRGEFIFNFCIVLEEDAEQSSYVPIVRKLGMLFRNLEEQSCFLSDEKERLDGMSADERAQEGGGKVYALCEVVFEDLNNYCECMIPIGTAASVRRVCCLG